MAAPEQADRADHALGGGHRLDAFRGRHADRPQPLPDVPGGPPDGQRHPMRISLPWLRKSAPDPLLARISDQLRVLQNATEATNTRLGRIEAVLTQPRKPPDEPQSVP